MSLESKVSASGFGGDAVTTAARQSDGGSAQEQLAKLQILMLKHQAHTKRRSSNADEKEFGELFGNLSEVESVAVDVLKGLNKFPESSPESCQVAQQTGTKDRFEQSMWIAERIVAQERAKMFMGMYGADQGAVRSEFYDRQAEGLTVRQDRLNKVKEKRDASRSMAEALRDATAALASAAGGSSGGSRGGLRTTA